MTLLDTVLPFFVILIVLIVVHELGHYITAKLFRVKVLEAGLGYPPRVWGFTWRDTIYSINALPLGGFVRLLGEEDPGDPDSLAAKPRWVRLIVLASGSGMNFLLPIFLFALAFMIPPPVALGPPPHLVDAVDPGDTTTTVADYLGVSAEAVMDAAGIKFTLDEGQVLAVQTDDGPVTSTVQRGGSVATVPR